jgi:hypothetical protein
MNRNRTIRRGHDLSGSATIFRDYSLNEGLQKLLTEESEIAFKKPWHRLERGLRLNRLRLFCDNMKDTKGLQEKETSALLTLLTKALEKKVLNSKNSISPDPSASILFINSSMSIVKPKSSLIIFTAT